MEMFEILVGLKVKDSELYQEYRKHMTPILAKYGGGFSYDFIVDKTLKSSTTNEINRVFTIYFNDRKASEEFFSNSEYLEIRNIYFNKSVESTTIIAEYDKASKLTG
jgi:uncharacterized protein (DUF1330 family)